MSQAFIDSLKIMGIGMIGIFAFMLVFYLVIIGLDRLFPHKEEE